MVALSVVLAPRGPAAGVLDALQDLSSLSLVEPFLWVSAEHTAGGPVPAVEVRAGRRYRTTLQDVLVQRSPDRVRVCVLVPFLATVPDVPAVVEETVAEIAGTSSGGARVERLRCILARPGAGAGLGELAREGWHNLLVAPQDADGPTRGHVLLPATADPLDLGRHGAPLVAGLLGLWTGLEQAPLDDQPALPGRTVRLVRSFYRNLDAGEVERVVRDRVGSMRAGLPLPREHGQSAVYVEDLRLATSSMARALWTKHADVLQGPRVGARAEAVRRVGVLAALRMLIGFLGAAVRNAPAAWYAAVVNQVSSAVASSVHATVFGAAPSAYEVVVKGVTSRGLPVGWDEISEAARQLDDSLVVPGEPREHETAEHSAELWRDYTRAALTLADGGLRDPALPPVQIGSARGVLRSATDIAPGAEAAFTEISGYVAASTGTAQVGPVDVLGAATLRQRLDALSQDPAAALEADRARQALARWQEARSSSFAIQVGAVLGRRVTEVAAETRTLLARIAALAAASDADSASRAHQRRLARWLRLLLIAVSVVLVVVVGVAVAGVVGPVLALVLAAGALVSWFAATVVLFMTQQRALFREIHRRKVAVTQMEATRANLRHALRDLRRLTAAYRQFLAWSAVLAVVLEQPFGTAPVDVAADAGGQLYGLGHATRLGRATVDEAVVDEAATLLRRDVFVTGWLTAPFETVVREAPDRIGSDAYDLRRDPEALYGLPVEPGASLLARWQAALVAEGVGRTGGDALWHRVLSDLDGRAHELGDRLVGSVQPCDGRRPLPRADFMAGIDESEIPPSGLHFDPAPLSAAARARGAGEVDLNVGLTRRRGLGHLAVLTQVGAGLPTYDIELGPRQGLVDPLAPGPDPAEPLATRPWERGGTPDPVF
ncbi:MAG TPA: hypothetical protein VGC57_09890 [Cellulomonas sp.]